MRLLLIFDLRLSISLVMNWMHIQPHPTAVRLFRQNICCLGHDLPKFIKLIAYQSVINFTNLRLTFFRKDRNMRRISVA